MRKKILITTFTFPPNKDGVAQAAWSMAVGLADRGFEVVIATGHLPERTDFLPHPRVRVEQFDIASDWKITSRSHDEVERMQRFIVDEDPAVILCHCWEIWSTAIAQNVFGRVYAKKILVSHGYSSLWRPHRKFPWGLGVLIRSLIQVAKLPQVFNLYDRVIFLNKRRDWNRFLDHNLAILSRYSGIRIIPNGTDAEPARSSTDEFRLACNAADQCLVLCVSNYLPGKNQALALNIFKKARLADATLVFIGSSFNDYSATLMALNEKLRRDYPEGRVIFLQQLDRMTTMAAYAACDIFLFTSKSEVAPFVILEAMAAGKPFVSTDVGCVRELPGGIIANGEENLITALACLRNDKAKRQALGAVGRQAVLDQYSREKVLDAQERMIRELLEQQ